jgi:hypothetical protein
MKLTDVNAAQVWWFSIEHAPNRCWVELKNVLLRQTSKKKKGYVSDGY